MENLSTQTLMCFDGVQQFSTINVFTRNLSVFGG